jgi:xanthine dehydrogenase accessory factor
MKPPRLSDIIVGLKGAGEMASGIAWRLYEANIRKLFLMEIPEPLAVRREVCFSEAVFHGKKAVEGVQAVRTEGAQATRKTWEQGKLAVIVDPKWTMIEEMCPVVVVDSILAKRNLGTSMKEAPLVIGLGPGFTAGRDVHMVIETNRGHNLGRIILEGSAEANTGVPGVIGGYAGERVIRAPVRGWFTARVEIGDKVRSGDLLGDVDAHEVRAEIDGVVRGLIASGCLVSEGLKLGDIDPRGDESYCTTISEKSRAIGGAVLEAILRVYNK